MCPITCIREEQVEKEILSALDQISLTAEEVPLLSSVLDDVKCRQSEYANKLRRDMKEKLQQVESSIKVLLQKFIENVLPKETFDEGHAALLKERNRCEEVVQSLESGNGDTRDQLSDFVTFIHNARSCFLGNERVGKRRVVDRIFERITTDGSAVIRVAFCPLFEMIAAREKTERGWNILVDSILREVRGEFSGSDSSPSNSVVR